MSFHVPEKYRIKAGPFKSSNLDGNNGAFEFKHDQIWIRIIASDGDDWDHVSVSLSVKRCPDWEEMCLVKSMFWDDEDTVIQFHPPKSEYVNNHNFCLHLWRPQDYQIKTPPSYMIGIK